jgi:hypothetical protein
MRKKIMKLEISVESDDLNNSEELCSNFIVSNINETIKKADKKYNNSFLKVRRVTIKSKFE